MSAKLITLLLFLFFCTGSLTTNAQQKYALLIGINNYYQSPGVVSGHSLQGCVNDANSMKALFINRFGFSEQNIRIITDDGATKKKVVAALLDMANTCKAGDAFVFYFSGHGVWMSNEGNVTDPIKRGMNQAMVMSDLYSKNLGCLLTDAMMKKLINRFVDKKVIATSIIDCCFSGYLFQAGSPFGHNAYTYPYIEHAQKSIDFDDIPYYQDERIPRGFVDYQVYSELYNADDTARANALVQAMQHPEDSAGAQALRTAQQLETLLGIMSDTSGATMTASLKDHGFDEDIMNFGIEPKDSVSEVTRSYNLKDAIHIFDPEIIPRPSERPHSQFLSLAGTNDVEKGLEVKDSYGNRHGAFTMALLNVYKKNSADIPVHVLMEKITLEMQPYGQTPTYFYEQSRLSGNLLGIPAVGFKNTITAKCVSVNGNAIGIDMGYIAGLSKGNYFMHRNGKDSVVIQLDSVSQFSASGKIKQGKLATAKTGDDFILTKNYVSKTPLIKIYIPQAKLTNAAFNDFFNKKIIPLVRKPAYSDLKNFDNSILACTIFYRDATHVDTKGLQHVLSGSNNDPFFVLLATPVYIAAPVIQVLQKNGNMQIVNSATDADFVLYLNYIKGDQENKPGFVFSLQKLSPGSSFINGYEIYPLFAESTTMNINGTSLNKVAANINAMVLSATEYNTGRKWINE